MIAILCLFSCWDSVTGKVNVPTQLPLIPPSPMIVAGHREILRPEFHSRSRRAQHVHMVGGGSEERAVGGRGGRIDSWGETGR